MLGLGLGLGLRLGLGLGLGLGIGIGLGLGLGLGLGIGLGLGLGLGCEAASAGRASSMRRVTRSGLPRKSGWCRLTRQASIASSVCTRASVSDTCHAEPW